MNYSDRKKHLTIRITCFPDNGQVCMFRRNKWNHIRFDEYNEVFAFKRSALREKNTCPRVKNERNMNRTYRGVVVVDVGVVVVVVDLQQ